MASRSRRCLLLLEKCKNMKQLKQAHGNVITCGLGHNGFALSRLLAFCSNPIHGSLEHGRTLFQHVQQPTICIFNTMIKAFLFRGEFLNAIKVFTRMLEDGICPDNYTLPYVLKACAKLRSSCLGEVVHGYCLRLGFVFDVFVGNSLVGLYCVFENVKAARHVFDGIPGRSAVSCTVMISGYAKVGDVEMARLLFDEVPMKDVGVWGAMISVYVQNNCFKEALFMFRLMQLDDVVPDEAIFVSILSSCAHLGALDIGIWTHGYLSRLRLPLSVHLSTGLIDMYAKCGNLNLAKRLFDEMPYRDTICWNAMISGMALHGDSEGALRLFSEMEKSGIRPDEVTFVAVFAACSYSGMAREGLRLLERMCTVYKLDTKSEHYGSIVDLLTRAGLFKEAKDIIEKIPVSSNPSEEAVAWRTLLSACCNHGQAQLVELAAERLMQLEYHSGVYVMLSNLYAAEGKHDDARRIRKMMKNKGIEKIPGCSSVKIDGVVSEFIAGDKEHPHMDLIHGLLEKMNKQMVSSTHLL